MSPGIRFLAFVVGGWVAIRSLVPLYEYAARAEAPAGGIAFGEPSAIPAVVPSELSRFAPAETGGTYPSDVLGAPTTATVTDIAAADARWSAARPVVMPVYVPAPGGWGRDAAPSRTAASPDVAPDFGDSVGPPVRTPLWGYASTLPPAYPQLAQWPLSSIPSASVTAPVEASDAFPGDAPGVSEVQKVDKLQLAMWAMMRDRAGEAMGLANAGVLDASQAGFRVSYSINHWLFANLRMSGPISTVNAGGEAAGGVGFRLFPRIPVNFMIERRQRIGASNGRNAVAVLVEGGVWQKKLPFAGIRFDAYGQAGVVGLRSRDWFVDGQATFTRPIFKQLSAGIGVWGGAQPGLARLDVGPRVSMRVGPRMAVHVDYRQQVLGNAYPRKGATVTLAGDF